MRQNEYALFVFTASRKVLQIKYEYQLYTSYVYLETDDING